MSTVLETIQGGTRYLEKRGVESARLNMEHLLAKVLDCKRMTLYIDFDRPLEESELEPLRELLKKRGERVPLQHLLGTVDFRGHEFLCDGRALVPRPETEELVDLASAELNSRGEPARVLDLGTGSGAIGLSLALETEAKIAELVLADVSPEALGLARDNADKWSDDLKSTSLTFAESDLFGALEGTFDLIVANLPYVGRDEAASLEPEVREHDPDLALYGGADGTDVIARFASEVRPFLADDAVILLEIGAGQADGLGQCLANAGLRGVEKREDLSKIERFLLARA